MKNKKYLPLKIIHLLLMILGLCYYLYSLIGIKDGNYKAEDVVFIIIFTVATVCALISGILYLTHGYKKNAVAYYNVYIWIILVNEIFTSIWGNKLADSYFLKSVCTIALVLLTALVVGKDLGKTKSLTIAMLFSATKLILLINSLSLIQVFGSVGISIVLGYVGQIILAITTCLMFYGKYLDKESRGTK